MIEDIIEVAIEKNASDIHIRSDKPAAIRVEGELIKLDIVTPKEVVTQFAMRILDDRCKEVFLNRGDVDLSFSLKNLRFRTNIFKSEGNIDISLRIIPTKILDFESLNLPMVLKKICEYKNGIILVTGSAGSGKSTTLASMIDWINSNYSKHIITIEDPIEFKFYDKKSVISQREVGADTVSFNFALRAALREDPNIIMIGEMRDLETVATALTAAQTGHLILTTSHTIDAVQTITRIIDFFPPHQQNQIRFQLADTLRAVISMRLLPRIDTKGRIPICEVLIATETVKKFIEENRLKDIEQLIKEGSFYGMQTFDQALIKAVKENKVDISTALEHASNPHNLELELKGIKTGSSIEFFR
ncbi:MAG: PilT/PilU family type 4a pilus ATPase [bacterium]|nr:PilT/PilU family type 4a pilus ATPase [bacterium]